MSNLPYAVPTPSSISTTYAASRAALQKHLAHLDLRIAKHEAKHQTLHNESLNQPKPSPELDKKITAEKNIIQGARQEYERALAAFLAATQAKDDEVVRRIKASEEALEEIRFEMEEEK